MDWGGLVCEPCFDGRINQSINQSADSVKYIGHAPTEDVEEGCLVHVV